MDATTQRLAGRAAIVTGASRGLGEAIALAFAREGAAVAVTARTEAEWDPRLPGTIHDTVARIEAAGGRAVAVAADLAAPADVERLVAEARSRPGAHRRAGEQRGGHGARPPPDHGDGRPAAPRPPGRRPRPGPPPRARPPRRCRTTWPSDASRSRGSGCTSRSGCSPPTA